MGNLTHRIPELFGLGRTLKSSHSKHHAMGKDTFFLWDFFSPKLFFPLLPAVPFLSLQHFPGCCFSWRPFPALPRVLLYLQEGSLQPQSPRGFGGALIKPCGRWSRFSISFSFLEPCLKESGISAVPTEIDMNGKVNTSLSFPLLPGESCLPWERLWALIYCFGKMLGGLLGKEKGKGGYRNAGNSGKEGEKEFRRGRACLAG